MLYLCSDIEEELNNVFNLYKKGGAIYPYSDGNNKQRAVYFVKVVFEEATRSIFMAVLKIVPLLFGYHFYSSTSDQFLTFLFLLQKCLDLRKTKSILFSFIFLYIYSIGVSTTETTFGKSL